VPKTVKYSEAEFMITKTKDGPVKKVCVMVASKQLITPL